MIKEIRRAFGLESIEEKLSTLRDIDSRLNEISYEINELSKEYTIRNEAKDNIIKSTDSSHILDEVINRFDLFQKYHLDKLLPLKKEKDSLSYEKQTLLKSNDVNYRYEFNKKYSIFKSKYKDKSISSDVFNTFLKSKHDGKTLYSDILVFNKEGKLLLLKRAATDDSNPQKWGLPGGHVDPNESHQYAATRELVEETGLYVPDLDFCWSFNDKDVHIEYFRVDNVCEMENPIILQADEHTDYKWIDIKYIDKYEMPFNMAENIKKALGVKDEIVKSEQDDLSTFLEPFLKAYKDGIISETILSNVIKARTHKYMRKTPDGKGGWNYMYEEGKDDENKTDLENTLNKVEKEIVNLDYEHGYCFDKDGKELFNQKGGTGSIAISDENLSKLKGNIFTHNHPSWKRYSVLKEHGTVLSIADIKLACFNNLKELRCVSGIYTYSLSKKDNTNFNIYDLAEINKAFRGGISKVAREIDIKNAGELETLLAIHIINSGLFNSEIYNYKSEKL